MKKFLFMAAAALLLAGCNRNNAGGANDQYNSSSGTSTSSNSAPSISTPTEAVPNANSSTNSATSNP